MDDNNQQVAAFELELDALIKRFGHEYDLNYASIIGTLQLKIHALCQEALEDDE